ncbi:hypothetical protein G6O69_29165 [Pseudenhygromyxa sp. WMMC2535]|uniref:hypothetical protein n=1 Tax=Pseudenhygromyxa sp. WMMC2535 TaxID=2712867 RepID=UPI00155420E3|nr:hypothetical protein [Pseudenhygromyxa sp. WMMC2535]NVB41936.1 hypothetical protein [Pseudenhygromyxa sp. WMMC2535]
MISFQAIEVKARPWVVWRKRKGELIHRSMKSISYAFRGSRALPASGRLGPTVGCTSFGTFVTSLAAVGRPVREFMELAGHQSLGVTQRYMHLVSGAREEGVAALEAFYESRATIAPPPDRREPDRAVGGI